MECTCSVEGVSFKNKRNSVGTLHIMTGGPKKPVFKKGREEGMGNVGGGKQDVGINEHSKSPKGG